MVATFFVCIALVYSNAKGSPKTPSGMTDRPVEEAEQPSTRRRHAA